MARKITKKLQQIEGVAAGQTAVIKMPIGLTYHDMTIPYSGVTLSEMEEIRLVANGEVLRRYSGGDRLDLINQFDRMNAANGILRLNFERYGLITRNAREFTVIGTGLPRGEGDGQDARKITSLQVEIDIATGATSPSIRNVRARMSAPRPSGRILRVAEHTYNPGGSGEYEINDLPIVGGEANRVIFYSADIDRVEVEVDGNKVFDRRKEENDLILEDGVRTPQSGTFVVDMTEDGYGGDPLNVRGAQDVRFTLHMAAGGQIPVTVETLDRVRKVS